MNEANNLQLRPGESVVRVDGFNIYATVLDTDQVSVQRGSSQALLQLAFDQKDLAEAEKGGAVSTGASTALLKIPTNNLASFEAALQRKLSDPLNTELTFRAVAVSASGASAGNFASLEKHAMAANRWQQMQTVRLVPCGPPASLEDKAVCHWDGIRPANASEKVSGHRASASVHTRFQAGRKDRQKIYASILGAAGLKAHSVAGLEFTQDLHELAEYQDAASLDFRMKGKIAIIYADGNKFGKRAVAAARDGAGSLAAWDKAIKQMRANLLNDLIKKLKADNRMFTAEEKLRFETLEWGGDELLFVLPAYAGFEFVKQFFELTTAWKDKEGRPLTHAVGMVLCKHKAPLRQVRALARRLGDHAKGNRSEQNALTFTTLESFDHLGIEVNDGLHKRFRGALAPSEWVLSANEVASLVKVFDAAKPDIPRSQVISAAYACLRKGDGLQVKALQHAYRECFQDNPAKLELAALWKTLTNGELLPEASEKEWKLLASSHARRFWITCAEAIDYLGHFGRLA